MALSAALPKSRYAFWSGQGLWYCSCGGVNRESETACHRCSCRREEAQRLASAHGLRQVRREQAEEQERLAREDARRREEAQARKKAAQQQLAGFRARFHRGAAPAAAPPETAAPLPHREPGEKSTPEIREVQLPAAGESSGQPVETAPGGETAPARTPAANPRRRGKKALGIAAVVVLLAAGFFFLSRLLGGTDADIGITGVRVLHVTAPGDGETVLFTVEEDDEGVCTVTPELVQEQIPGVAYINLDGVPDMGDDIDAYLINSFQMAMLVSSRGEYGSEGEWGSFDANRDPNSPLCLLLYDSNFHLMGHAVGVPQEAGDGQWQLEVTLCDYDFTALFEQQLSDFEAQREEIFAHYIAPENIIGSGAEYFLEGYNTGRGPTLLPGDAQGYHLWAQYSSPYVAEHSRSLDRLRDRLPREDRWRCFLFLDGDYQLLGYTMMDSTGGGGQVTDTDITPLGTAELILRENSDGNCEFTEDLLRQAVPEMDFFNFGGYMPDLSGDVKAYVKDTPPPPGIWPKIRSSPYCFTATSPPCAATSWARRRTWEAGSGAWNSPCATMTSPPSMKSRPWATQPRPSCRRSPRMISPPAVRPGISSRWINFTVKIRSTIVCGSRACGAGPPPPISAGSAAPSPICPTRPGGLRRSSLMTISC